MLNSMTQKVDRSYRKRSRDFKNMVELTKKTPLKDLERMFIELYDYSFQKYIETETRRHPDKSTKQIIIELYELRKKLKR